MIAAIEAWRSKQKPAPNLSEAIRRLVEIGLSVKSQARPSAKVAARAAELAAKVIEQHVDETVPAEEKATRKRRLIKGPEAFRDVRVDRPKVK